VLEGRARRHQRVSDRCQALRASLAGPHLLGERVGRSGVADTCPIDRYGLDLRVRPFQYQHIDRVVLAAGHSRHQRRALESGRDAVSLQRVFMLVDAEGDIESQHQGSVNGLRAARRSGGQQH